MKGRETMRILEFVITGGPCAGKTTGLSILDQTLTQKGYKVIIVAETATELISSGITPNDLSVRDFQSIILERFLNKEDTTRQAAKCMKQDVVILYDRGVLDNKAYMPYEMFIELLAEKGLTETVVRDQYDAVFHLVTAADGAEQFYTLENNAARTETSDEARALDTATLNSWIGHPHLRVIDNSTPFEQKIDRLLSEVFSVIGIPVPVKTQKKYLIQKPDLHTLGSVGSVKLTILQTYLHSDDSSIERRIRQRGDGKSFSYYYAENKVVSDMSCLTTEKRISEKAYLILLLEGKKSVRKDRHCFIHANQYFELDIYPNWEEEAILEIKFTEESQTPSIPDWVSVIKDVTGDPAYRNANLAK